MVTTTQAGVDGYNADYAVAAFKEGHKVPMMSILLLLASWLHFGHRLRMRCGGRCELITIEFNMRYLQKESMMML